MEDIKNILGSAGVPEQDPDYWRSFPERVKARCPAASAKPSAAKTFRRFAAAIAGAAALVAVSAAGLTFLSDSGKPSFHPEITLPTTTHAPPRGVAAAAEAGRTARLAGLSDAGVLGVLQEAASEKTIIAKQAMERLDIVEIAPLARSYVRIMREGMRPRLSLAAESGEDLSALVPVIMSALKSDAAAWKSLGSKSQDAEVCREISDASVANQDVRRILEEEFPIGRH